MTDPIHALPGLPERPRDAHKGDFGRILIVGGSTGMTGAPCMAALAAQKAGGGLVTLALPEGLNYVAELRMMSCMSLPLPEPRPGILGEAAAAEVLDRADAFDAVAIGPGVGRAPETARCMRRLSRELPLPLLVDADGLNALAGAPDLLRDAPAPRLLTPHPGEMSRLLGRATVADVQADRVGVAEAFARDHGVLLALKGAGTVVTDGRTTFVNPSGNPGMATGGTGDVLTGLASGLLCQCLQPLPALCLAVFVHGLAGDLAARAKGELSLTAEDVLDCTPAAFEIVRKAGAGADAAEVAARHAAGDDRGA